MKRVYLLLLIFFSLFNTYSAPTVFNFGRSEIGTDLLCYKYGREDKVILLIGGALSTPYISSSALRGILSSNNISDAGNYSLWIVPDLGITTQDRYSIFAGSTPIRYDFIKQDIELCYYSRIIDIKQGPHKRPESQALVNLVDSIVDKEGSRIILLSGSGSSVITSDNQINTSLALELFQDLNYDYHQTDKRNITMEYYFAEHFNIPTAIVEFKEIENAIPEIQELLVKISNHNSFIPGFFRRSFTVNNSIYLRGHQNKYLNIIQNNPAEFINSLSETLENTELLLLVNKSNLLSSDYRPNDLIDYTPIIPCNRSPSFLRAILKENLEKMVSDSRHLGLNLKVISSYRSYEQQRNTFNYWVNTLGHERAVMVSAVAGASQHQLGTAIDFNSLETTFGDTPEGRWLYNNSYKYGFIISYPEGLENLTGYTYEPWHYRYIGTKSAFIVKSYYNNILEDYLNWFWCNIKTL